MKLPLLYLSLLFAFTNTYSQNQIHNFKEKFELPEKVKETSGLLFLDGKIITHNDSGDAAKLYEVDSLSGAILRTVSISNATNVDWEDLAENDTHIFIADIGNNNGNREDLKIYTILKSDFKESNTVSAATISFSYEDQTVFSSQTNSSNFDAEGIVIYENQILIFTKNWADLKTNVYKIPLTPGSHVASKISSGDIQGLITSATYTEDRFFLTGYDTSLTPFLIYISYNRMPGENIFFSGFTKISLKDKIGQGSQIEAITNISNTGKYYISRENFSTTISGTTFTFKQKLYEFYDETSVLLSISENKLTLINISPNPATHKIKIKTSLPFSTIEIYNSFGKKVPTLIIPNEKEIDISFLSKGVYYLKIHLKDNNSIVRKIVKL
ncbi:MAG: hypothetical protein ACI9KF_000855 [Arenicella sp.]